MKGVGAWCAVVVLALAPRAHAQDETTVEPPAEPAATEAPVPANVAEARERIARGEALFARDDYEAALVEFEAAYRRIGEHPNRHLVLYNIARCHELLFHYDEALTFYRRYLTEGGADADGRDEVEATLRTLENLLATVEVRVEGPGGELWVDGHLVGEAPGTVSVTAGRHVIEARADGYVPAAREVETPARREVTVVLVMVAVGGDEFEGLHPAFFGTAVGLAIASGVTSAIFGLRAIAARNGVDERLADPRERWTLEQSDIDEIGQLALAADLFLGGALLFAATAAVLALLTDWGGDDDEEPSAALEGLGLRVRY